MRESHIRGPVASPCDPDNHGQREARRRLDHSTLGVRVIKKKKKKKRQVNLDPRNL